MATTTWSIAPALGTGGTSPAISNFNAFYASFQAAIIALGWVQTSDTGQVNFTTNAATPAEGTYTLYQIFRMDDALQATAPVYLKIFYHYAGTSTVVPPSLSFQLAFATDGAGNLTGDFTPLIAARAGSGTATAYTHFGSGDGSRLWILLSAYVTATSADSAIQLFFSVERSKDANGLDTADFVTLNVTGSVDAAGRQITLHRTYGATAAENRWAAALPYTSANASYGGAGGTFPVFPLCGRLENPLLNIAVGKRSDFPNASNVVVDGYGTARTYKAFNSATTTAPTSLVAPTGAGNASILARYE